MCTLMYMLLVQKISQSLNANMPQTRVFENLKSLNLSHFELQNLRQESFGKISTVSLLEKKNIVLFILSMFCYAVKILQGQY